MGKTGYYCLLDSMELLLSLWLNKTKARPFVSFHRQKTTSRLELIKETLCMRVCEWEICDCVCENPSVSFLAVSCLTISRAKLEI